MSEPIRESGRFSIWSMVAGCALILLLAVGMACGEGATPTPSPTPTPTPIPGFPLVITDSNGQAVTLEEPPQRIVAYESAAVEILYAMGEGERIVGAHDFVSHPAEALDLPKVGGAFEINREKIVALEPDLIITFYAGSLPDLEGLGANLLYLEQPDDFEGISEQMRLWGQITGNKEAAEKVAADFELGVQKLVDRLATVERGPRIFHDDSSFFTRGPDTLLGRVYTLLKAENIAEGGYGQLSPEVIVDKDPEVIITTFPEGLQPITDNPALQGVSAVRQGQVYAIDAEVFSISVPGPRFVEAMEELARLIHPDLFEQ